MDAHRKTSTWIFDTEAEGGTREVPQYWFFYDCKKCGDRWEMMSEGVDRPKEVYWCPSCKARGMNDEERQEAKAASN